MVTEVPNWSPGPRDDAFFCVSWVPSRPIVARRVRVALIDIMVACLKASFAVVLLLGLTIYLYSIIGMNMFGAALPTPSKAFHRQPLSSAPRSSLLSPLSSPLSPLSSRFSPLSSRFSSSRSMAHWPMCLVSLLLLHVSSISFLSIHSLFRPRVCAFQLLCRQARCPPT